jgi:hypothetical protein
LTQTPQIPANFTPQFAQFSLKDQGIPGFSRTTKQLSARPSAILGGHCAC